MSKPFPGEEPTISAKDSTANPGEPRKSVRTRPALLRKQRLLSALPMLSEPSASPLLVEERSEQDDFRPPSEVEASPTQPLSEDQPAQADSRAQPSLAKLEETSERFNTELMGTRQIAGVDDPHNSTPDPAAMSDTSIISDLLDGVEDAGDARGSAREREEKPEDIDLVGLGPTLPRQAASLPRHAPARHRLSRARYHIYTKHARRSQGQERKQRVRRIWASVLFALMLILLSSSMSTSYHYYQSMIPRLQDLLNKHIEQSTRIYDRNGKLLYTLYDPNQGRSIPISYDQIPGVLQDAQIAAEDKTFWTNDGVDVKATIRSAIVDMVARKAETGASTLTQQVIKNLSHDTDISGQRKLNEATLAIALTQTYPKWKILEMYFNIAPYGAQDLGVEAAVEDYFGLTPSCDLHFHCTPATAFLDRDLSHCTRPQDESTCQSNPLLALARATLLAGIPQNPVNFDPMLSPANVTALLQRQDYVLQQMLKAHMQINLGLGSQTRDEGEITPKVIQQVESLSRSIQFVGFQNRLDAPHFVWWVIQSLANMLGNYQQINPNTGISGPGLLLLLTGGFNIRTTIDLNLEEYVESATQRHLNQPEKQKLTGQIQTSSTDSNIHDAATVVLDSHTGEILAMDGSASWTDSDPRVAGELNGALTLRQPASTFKPIIMAAAFEQGWYPGIVLPDTRTYFPLPGVSQKQVATSYNTYMPTDYGNTYSGRQANIDFAISNSLNVPAVKAYMYAGQANVYNMARRLGITTINPKQVNATIALGTAEVPLLQMVGAYQVFANAGRRAVPQSILSISDNYGHLYYAYDPTHPSGGQVISPQIAYLITSILSDEAARSYEFKSDHDLSLQDWRLPDGTFPDVAAKTGTSDNFKDNWTIGYTPNLVVGVWAGNANGAPATTDSIGMVGAAPLWHSVIEYASGRCNQANDQIPCPPFDLNAPTTYHFTVPAGLIQQQVNTFNGLAGTGYSTWMLKGEQPSQNGWG